MCKRGGGGAPKRLIGRHKLDSTAAHIISRRKLASLQQVDAHLAGGELELILLKRLHGLSEANRPRHPLRPARERERDEQRRQRPLWLWIDWGARSQCEPLRLRTVCAGRAGSRSSEGVGAPGAGQRVEVVEVAAH